MAEERGARAACLPEFYAVSVLPFFRTGNYMKLVGGASAGNRERPGAIAGARFVTDGAWVSDPLAWFTDTMTLNNTTLQIGRQDK